MLWIIVIGVLLLLILAAAAIVYRLTFGSPEPHEINFYDLPKGDQYEPNHEHMTNLIRELEAVPFEQVYITAKDGTRLAARYYHVQDGAPLHIQFHGYRGSSLRDFCGGNKLARSIGHNTLLVDQRGIGLSGGNAITFGIKERYDCKAWAEYATERFGEIPIVLSGGSMGATTVLMASELPLPKNVRCVVADCPFSEPAAIICKVAKDIGIPRWVTLPLAELSARLFGHFSLMDASAVKAVQNTHLPVLILHGEDDRFVPCSMSREIYEAAAGEKVLVTFPGAGHGISYLVDPPTYHKAVVDFLQKTLQ